MLQRLVKVTKVASIAMFISDDIVTFVTPVTFSNLHNITRGVGLGGYYD